MNDISVKSETIDSQEKNNVQSSVLSEKNDSASSKVNSSKPKILSPHFGNSPNTKSMPNVSSTKKRKKKTLFQQSKSSKSYQNSSLSNVSVNDGITSSLKKKPTRFNSISKNVSVNITTSSKSDFDTSLIDGSSSKVKMEDGSRSTRDHNEGSMINQEANPVLSSSFLNTEKENTQEISFSKMFSTPQFSKHSKVGLSQVVKKEEASEHSHLEHKSKIKQQSVSLPEILTSEKNGLYDENEHCQSFDAARLHSFQKFYLKEPAIENWTGNKKEATSAAGENSQHTHEKEFLSSTNILHEKSILKKPKKNTENKETIPQDDSFVLPGEQHSNRPHDSPSVRVKKNVSFSLNNISIISDEPGFVQKPSNQEEPVVNDCKDPGEYHAINELLFDRPVSSDNGTIDGQSGGSKETPSYIDLFQDVGDKQAQGIFAKYGALSLEQWVQTGLNMNTKHQALIEKIIIARIKLSHKFKVITDLLNERAQELNQNGELINEKLVKIKDLGNEILNIM